MKEYILQETNDFFKKMDIPFRKLVLSYYENEEYLRQRVLIFLKNCLSQKGYEIKDKVIRKDKNIYRVDSEFVRLSRGFSIIIEPIITDNIRNNILSIQIEKSFGLIKDVNLVLPFSLYLDGEQIKSDIKLLTESFYEILEKSFLRNSEELSAKIFRKIYDRINLHLYQNSKSHLNDKYWLAIGHSNAFHYFLDSDKTKTLITYFRKNQKNDISPFELIIALMKTPLDFQESLTAESQRSKQNISKKWSELSYVNLDEKLLYVLAERELYPSDGHTAKAISESRNYILGIACSNDNAEEIGEEVFKIEEDVDKIFKEGTKEYSIYFRTIHKFKHSMTDWDKGELGKFTGAFMTEVLKNLSS
jgi:hypothetical protein